MSIKTREESSLPVSVNSCIILAVGTELVEGNVQDQHLKFLGPELKDRGILVSRYVLLPDSFELMVQELKRGLAEARVVLVTGGLGPTSDDLTREVAAAAAGVELEFHDNIWESLKLRFQGRRIADSNRKQAMIPAGFTVMENPFGTAPGFFGTVGNSLLFVVPGPPREMIPMVQNWVLPELTSRLNLSVLPFEITAGAFLTTESELEEGLLACARPGCHWRTRLESDRILFTLLGEEEALLREFFNALIARFKAFRIREGNSSISEHLFQALLQKGQTISFAESCTGGMLGKLITDFSGSSSVFKGGFMVYSNEAKQKLLGVAPEILEAHGAVSGPVVKAMALGALQALDTDYSIAVSGVAGPGGGSAEKPVGTVWIGWASRSGDVRTRVFHFSGDRERVRWKTAITAFSETERWILNEEGLDIFDKW